MKKIKVAFFADCLIENYDGAIRTMYQIINRIPTTQFEFLFITGEAPQSDFPHEVLTLPTIPLPMNHNYKLTLSFLAKGKISRRLKEFAPDIIHLSTPSPLGHTGLQYAQRHGIPTISIYHTHFISYVDYYLKHFPIAVPSVRRHLMSVMQNFYNNCDLVYVPTEQMKLELTNMGVFSNHLSIWKRGLTPGLFTPTKRQDDLLKSITKNDHPNILFSSRLVWEKNLNTLAAIYQAASEKGLTYNFIIAGDGYAKTDLQKLMPHAFFLGHLTHEKLASVYASSDVFLFPSISETYGNVVVEAMASGLPCVIANGGGTLDLIKHNYNGVICPPQDVPAYLRAIDTMLNNTSIRKRFIANGLNCTKDLSWDTLCQTYFNDLERLTTSVKQQRA